METRPVYDDTPGILDINPLIIGASFGPMDIVPEEIEDLTGRTYAASIFSASGAAIADFTITKITETGELDLSMTSTESATIPTAGTYDWAIVYTMAGDIKRVAWIGKVVCVFVNGISPVVP
jgi:hypothetical protein